MTRHEFSTLLHERSPDVAMELSRGGGLRGLFDTSCSEYKTLDAQAKLAMLRKLVALGFHIEQLEQPFVEIMQAHTYDPHEAGYFFMSGPASSCNWRSPRSPSDDS